MGDDDSVEGLRYELERERERLHSSRELLYRERERLHVERLKLRMAKNRQRVEELKMLMSCPSPPESDPPTDGTDGSRDSSPGIVCAVSGRRSLEDTSRNDRHKRARPRGRSPTPTDARWRNSKHHYNSQQVQLASNDTHSDNEIKTFHSAPDTAQLSEQAYVRANNEDTGYQGKGSGESQLAKRTDSQLSFVKINSSDNGKCYIPGLDLVNDEEKAKEGMSSRLGKYLVNSEENANTGSDLAQCNRQRSGSGTRRAHFSQYEGDSTQDESDVSTPGIESYHTSRITSAPDTGSETVVTDHSVGSPDELRTESNTVPSPTASLEECEDGHFADLGYKIGNVRKYELYSRGEINISVHKNDSGSSNSLDVPSGWCVPDSWNSVDKSHDGSAPGSHNTSYTPEVRQRSDSLKAHDIPEVKEDANSRKTLCSPEDVPESKREPNPGSTLSTRHIPESKREPEPGSALSTLHKTESKSELDPGSALSTLQKPESKRELDPGSALSTAQDSEVLEPHIPLSDSMSNQESVHGSNQDTAEVSVKPASEDTVELSEGEIESESDDDPDLSEGHTQIRAIVTDGIAETDWCQSYGNQTSLNGQSESCYGQSIHNPTLDSPRSDRSPERDSGVPAQSTEGSDKATKEANRKRSRKRKRKYNGIEFDMNMVCPVDACSRNYQFVSPVDFENHWIEKHVEMHDMYKCFKCKGKPAQYGNYRHHLATTHEHYISQRFLSECNVKAYKAAYRCIPNDNYINPKPVVFYPLAHMDARIKSQITLKNPIREPESIARASDSGDVHSGQCRTSTSTPHGSNKKSPSKSLSSRSKSEPQKESISERLLPLAKSEESKPPKSENTSGSAPTTSGIVQFRRDMECPVNGCPSTVRFQKCDDLVEHWNMLHQEVSPYYVCRLCRSQDSANVLVVKDVARMKQHFDAQHAEVKWKTKPGVEFPAKYVCLETQRNATYVSPWPHVFRLANNKHEEAKRRTLIICKCEEKRQGSAQREANSSTSPPDDVKGPKAATAATTSPNKKEVKPDYKVITFYRSMTCPVKGCLVEKGFTLIHDFQWHWAQYHMPKRLQMCRICGWVGLPDARYEHYRTQCEQKHAGIQYSFSSRFHHVFQPLLDPGCYKF